MFRALPPGSQIEAAPNRIVSLHRCLNSSPIALGGGPSVQSRASIIGVYNPDSSYSVYLALTPAVGSGGVLFCCDPRNITLAEYRAVEREAVELVEGQGFVMEPIEVKHASPQELDGLLAELPIVRPEFSSASGNFGRADARGGGVPPVPAAGLPRTRTGAFPPANPARSSQSRSGLYALPGQQRATYSSRITSAPPPPAPAAPAPAPALARTQTASFGRPGPVPTVSGPAPRASASGSELRRVPPGNASSLGRQAGGPGPGPRHSPPQHFNPPPVAPAMGVEDSSMSAEETIALLGRLLSLF